MPFLPLPWPVGNTLWHTDSEAHEMVETEMQNLHRRKRQALHASRLTYLINESIDPCGLIRTLMIEPRHP